MYNSIDYIKKDYDSQMLLKQKYERRLNELPKGSLSTTSANGKVYYSKIVDGEKSYIGKPNCEEVKAIQTKRFLEESIKRIDNNCNWFERFMKHYQSIELEAINRDIPRAYKLCSEELYKLTSPVDMEEWGNQEYDKSTKYPEGLVHRTLKGECVRSKSEVIIADMLFLKNIEYHYEENLKLGSEIIAPDFKVGVASQNRFKWIEHFGMISEPRYLDECSWKIRKYISCGYMPWEDVVFTFDSQDGNIDAQMIGWILDKFCT